MSIFEYQILTYCVYVFYPQILLCDQTNWNDTFLTDYTYSPLMYREALYNSTARVFAQRYQGCLPSEASASLRQCKDRLAARPVHSLRYVPDPAHCSYHH